MNAYTHVNAYAYIHVIIHTYKHVCMHTQTHTTNTVTARRNTTCCAVQHVSICIYIHIYTSVCYICILQNKCIQRLPCQRRLCVLDLSQLTGLICYIPVSPEGERRHVVCVVSSVDVCVCVYRVCTSDFE